MPVLVKFYCYMPLLLFMFLGNYTISHAQEREDESEQKMQSAEGGVPQVYIDCSSCNYNHVRREISFVNYVRDQEMADIHVFITDEGTGRGGKEYEFSFIGRNTFEGTEYSLNHHIGRNATSEETREQLNKYLKMGYALLH